MCVRTQKEICLYHWVQIMVPIHVKLIRCGGLAVYLGRIYTIVGHVHVPLYMYSMNKT